VPDETGVFADADIANVLQNATQTIAASFQARGTPEWMRVIEVLSIEQAREWGTCTVRGIYHCVGFCVCSSRPLYHASSTSSASLSASSRSCRSSSGTRTRQFGRSRRDCTRTSTYASLGLWYSKRFLTFLLPELGIVRWDASGRSEETSAWRWTLPRWGLNLVSSHECFSFASFSQGTPFLARFLATLLPSLAATRTLRQQ
jgi:hypothetical protein